MVDPYTTGGGKVVHARVQKVGEPTVVEERSWVRTVGEACRKLLRASVPALTYS